eukprot:m.213298 g.213298  ORF g.213298 m.213298 type:complete len:371 (-) comp25555_c0_seq1:203-1315(-)
MRVRATLESDRVSRQEIPPNSHPRLSHSVSARGNPVARLHPRPRIRVNEDERLIRRCTELRGDLWVLFHLGADANKKGLALDSVPVAVLLAILSRVDQRGELVCVWYSEHHRCKLGVVVPVPTPLEVMGGRGKRHTVERDRRGVMRREPHIRKIVKRERGVRRQVESTLWCLVVPRLDNLDLDAVVRELIVVLDRHAVVLEGLVVIQHSVAPETLDSLHPTLAHPFLKLGDVTLGDVNGRRGVLRVSETVSHITWQSEHVGGSSVDLSRALFDRDDRVVVLPCIKNVNSRPLGVFSLPIDKRRKRLARHNTDLDPEEVGKGHNLVLSTPVHLVCDPDCVFVHRHSKHQSLCLRVRVSHHHVSAECSQSAR